VIHPDPTAILRALHNPDSAEGKAVAHHLSVCPTCSAEARKVEAVRATLRSGEKAGHPTTECLDEDLLAAFADGTVDAEAREKGLQHLATCSYCQRVVASLAAALNDPAVAAAAGKGSGSVRRWTRLAVPAAAAAVLVIAILARQVGDGRPSVVHRAPPITAAAQPEAIAPVGVGNRPDRVRWTVVPGAELYRMTLYQADGAAIYEIETRDTTVAIPDSVRLMSGNSYLWKVEARTGWNRWSASRLFEFSVTAVP
jgi:anti-sigma factor ChrR (cupin superfamily)